MKLNKLLNHVIKTGFIKEEKPTVVPPQNTYMRHFSIKISFSVPENDFDIECGDINHEAAYKKLRICMGIAVDELLYAIQEVNSPVNKGDER